MIWSGPLPTPTHPIGAAIGDSCQLCKVCRDFLYVLTPPATAPSDPAAAIDQDLSDGEHTYIPYGPLADIVPDADGGMPEGGRSAGNSCGCAREEVVVWSTTIRGIVLPPEDEVRGALCGRVVKDVFDVFDDRVGL